MRIRRSVLVLSSLALALTLADAAFAGDMCKTPSLDSLHGAPATPLSGCSAWIRTIYFSSASMTTEVGICSISCRQFDFGDAEPTFSEGGTCSGVSSAYFSTVFGTCPCPQ